MKIKDILSNDEIFELQKNQGKSTDEILQIARDRYKEQLASGEIARKKQAELEYQKRNDLNAIKELNALKKEAIDKGASGAEIEQLQNNYNIMHYGTPEQKKQLEQAQNAAKIKQEMIDEAARNNEKYGGFSGGASRSLQKAWGNTLIGIGEAAKYLGIDSERLNRGTDYYKNAVEYLNDIDKSRQKQDLKTFSEDAGNFVGAIGGPGEVATLPFGFGKTALRTAGKFVGIELLGGTPRRIGESVTEPNSNLSFLEKSALESGLAGGLGGLLHGGYNLYKGLKGAKGAGRAETAPNTQNSSTEPNSAPNTPNSNADDLATNGIWLDYGNTAPQNGGLLRGDNFVTDPNSANVEQNIVANFELAPNVRDLTKISTDEISADLSHLSEKHPEMFEKASDVFKLIKEIKDEPQFFYRNNRLDGALIAKRLQEQGKIGKVVVNKENGEVIHATKAREQDLARLERVANKNDERVRALSAVSSRKVEQGGGLPSETIPQHPLNTADDIDLVPDENGVYQVAYNGSSKELAKIATEIAKGEIQSMGAKRLVYIADNIAETAAKDAEQKISANITKIDNDSVELYANNTALLGDIAKKYPMLNKDEQIELANKQILANASAELIEYSKFLNGGKLPNDARLLGKNLGRMILKSLNAGASKQEIIDMLLKAGISGRNSTAAKALLQTGDINAYNAVMRKAEAELIAELSQNVRVAAKNESIGAILDSAKEKAIKNDELLKKGVGNQGLDDVINTFKSSKSGKEFEVAENGFGRELLSYDGVAANEEMKRAFLAWEAQEKKADIVLNDGRKVVFLEPDEAVQLSYGNSYLYGEKDLEALFARRNTESLEQKLERLQSHPAYENLLKMRENTKASELKGDTFGGSKPTVFYEPQSERYLRTQGGGGLPNAERSITITKADVAKLRAGKADKALAIKLENNLEALTGDPMASGVIDELLTRDYHLASATKKSELVAPKNADEVAKTAENSIKGDGFVMSGNAVEPKSDLNVKISVDEWVKELAGINPNKQIIADLEHLYEKHKELFSKPSEVFKLIKAVKDNPTFFYTNNQPNIALIGSILENGKLGKIGIQKDFNSDNLQVRHATYSSNAKKENERLLKRNSYPVGSPTPTQLTFGKTAEPTANGVKALLGKEEMLTGTPLPATTRANSSMGGDLLQHSNAETIPNQSIKEAENQANLAERAAEFSKAYNAIKNIGKYTELLENDYKKIASLNTKDFAQRLKNDIEAYKELAELQEIAYKATNGLLYDDEYVKYFNVKQGQKGYLSKAQSIHDNAFEILDQAPNYISGLYYEISRLKALKSLSKKQDEELKKALKQVNLDAILDLAGLQNYKLMATKIKTALNALTRAKKILDETKSQSGGGLKRGFSTAEMPSAMLGGATGHMAGSAIGAVAGEYESEGGVAGAIIGALAGLASPKAAAKIAAKMIAKKASKIELMPNMPFKEAQDKVQKDLMKYVGVDIKNADSGIVAQINNNGAKKIVSNDAIQKSRNNKFSAGEHLSVAQKTPELFKDATFIGRYDDIKNGESSVKILRFAKNIEVKGKNAVAIITAKESVDKDLKRIYSMELEELRKAELKFGNYDKTQTPASKPLISQDNGVVNSVAPIKDGANSTPKEIKSQELSMRESFSPELKASYDMRDKLLKSTNEVRASLNEKGKAELEKLAGSKDSKLSRDAQIMKTLENAKSNPARYAKLKKLYLDENGKVKDSIGLC